MKPNNVLILTSAVILLSACSMTPEYQRPAVETPAWNSAQEMRDTRIEADWWKHFGSAELNGLIRRALDKNNNLQASLQRIEQARAGLKVSGASLLPSAALAANYMNGPTQATNITDMRDNDIPNYTVDAGIAYEVDLFGANRARHHAAAEALLEEAYRHDALSLVVMADVAKNYFNVLNIKERLRLAQDNLQAAGDLLEITRARFQTGARTQLDITRQETQVAQARAAVAELEQDLALAHYALAVLAGETPQKFRVTAEGFAGLQIPEAAVLQPSELLDRRPDIQSMEARLKSANADIGSARAAFYPSVTIGSGVLLAASPSASAFTVAGSLAAPIFQGGRLEGNLDRVTARQKELAENYQQTVLVAFQEAENALIKVQKTLEREGSLKQAVATSREAYAMAKHQYRLSVVDFQDVLGAQRSMLESEDRYERARYETLAARVELFKAMGGGWQPARP